MTNFVGTATFGHDQFFDRPPYFNGDNYCYWKNRMRIYLQAYDMNLWKVIVEGNKTPHKIPPVKEWNDEYMKLVQINSRAMHLLYCALGESQFILIFSCESAKEIWNKLELIYEGTSQVKWSKKNLLVSEYERFEMKSDDTIASMFTRFTDILNRLKVLGKTYPNVENVEKILCSLPKTWEPKVMAIEEAKDLSKLSLDELLGNLLTHEMTMKVRIEDFKEEIDEECYNCKKLGHKIAECPTLKNKDKNKRGNNNYLQA